MIEIIIPKFTIYYNIPDKDGIEENDITKRTIKMTKDYSFVILYIYLLILNKNNIILLILLINKYENHQGKYLVKAILLSLENILFLENFKGVKIQLNEVNISTLDILNELIKIKSLKIKTDGTIQSE